MAPDGWFAETQANKLGQVTLATGAIAETPLIPTPNSLPEDVAVNMAGYPVGDRDAGQQDRALHGINHRWL